jgi:hypothetical protein
MAPTVDGLIVPAVVRRVAPTVGLVGVTFDELVTSTVVGIVVAPAVGLTAQPIGQLSIGCLWVLTAV